MGNKHPKHGHYGAHSVMDNAGGLDFNQDGSRYSDSRGNDKNPARASREFNYADASPTRTKSNMFSCGSKSQQLKNNQGQNFNSRSIHKKIPKGIDQSAFQTQGDQNGTESSASTLSNKATPLEKTGDQISDVDEETYKNSFMRSKGQSTFINNSQQVSTAPSKESQIRQSYIGRPGMSDEKDRSSRVSRLPVTKESGSITTTKGALTSRTTNNQTDGTPLTEPHFGSGDIFEDNTPKIAMDNPIDVDEDDEEEKYNHSLGQFAQEDTYDQTDSTQVRDSRFSRTVTPTKPMQMKEVVNTITLQSRKDPIFYSGNNMNFTPMVQNRRRPLNDEQPDLGVTRTPKQQRRSSQRRSESRESSIVRKHLRKSKPDQPPVQLGDLNPNHQKPLYDQTKIGDQGRHSLASQQLLSNGPTSVADYDMAFLLCDPNAPQSPYNFAQSTSKDSRPQPRRLGSQSIELNTLKQIKQRNSSTNLLQVTNGLAEDGDGPKSAPRGNSLGRFDPSEGGDESPMLRNMRDVKPRASQNLGGPQERSNDQRWRTTLLSKLTYEKIWLTPEEKPKTHQTVIIFDWDDTLIPTTFLIPYQQLIYQPPDKPLPSQIKKKMQDIDEYSAKLLEQSKKNGKVLIITNAAEGWVELSAQRFMPITYQCLKSDIEIVSARTKYEKELPRQYQEWKIRAFLETTQKLEMQAVTNLVALGDNVFEIEAAHKLYQQFQSAFIKTIKFRSAPSTGELAKQIKLVMEQFNHICHSPKNLTVRLHRIENEGKAEKPAGKAEGGSFTGTGDHTNNLLSKLKPIRGPSSKELKKAGKSSKKSKK